MSIPMNSTCVECFFPKRLAFARAHGSEEQATQVAKLLCRLYGQSDDQMDSAQLGGICDEQISHILGLEPDRMKEEKELSNRFVLERLDSIYRRVKSAEDPIFAALQFAVLGNYLDFSALAGQVSFQDLDRMLDSASDIILDRDCYRQFVRELATGKRFLYLTDNAGEICFDRVLGEVIRDACPQLEITFCVRGRPVSNDATREDAKVAGIPFPVIDNGTAIGGTCLHLISPETKAAIENADVILAKGMGNTESLYGCGHNVYYAFLVKCPRFVEFFQKPKMTPMFIREKTE